jgi:hypothetical protein
MKSTQQDGGRRTHRSTPDGPLKRLRRMDGTQVPYGAIRFAGSKRMPSKWCCMGKDADLDDVVELMSSTWGLEKPPVIISVTGSAADSGIEMRSKDLHIFERGLRNAAKQTGAWILTGGTNSGVMQMVGNMVHKSGDAALVCLGIAPFGCVLRHEDLAQSHGRIYAYPKTDAPKKPPRATLDPNHSHFILVDDGTEGEFGGERAMRSALEDKICTPIPNDTIYDEKLPTPMVLLVVSGGPGTLDVIIYTLQKSRPVIVLADSGGISTKIYKYMTTGELPELSTKLKNGEPENKKEVDLLRVKLPEIKKLGEELKGANKVKQLTFFRSCDTHDGEHNDLETDILSAILSDCEKTEDAVMHAVKWSAPEVIDTQLQISRDIDAEGLVRAFQSALVVGTKSKSATNVVRMLIEYNVDARLVRFNRLFQTGTGGCPDPYETIDSWKKGAVTKRKALSFIKLNATSPAAVVLREEVDGFDLLSTNLSEMGYTKSARRPPRRPRVGAQQKIARGASDEGTPYACAHHMGSRVRCRTRAMPRPPVSQGHDGRAAGFRALGRRRARRPGRGAPALPNRQPRAAQLVRSDDVGRVGRPAGSCQVFVGQGEDPNARSNHGGARVRQHEAEAGPRPPRDREADRRSGAVRNMGVGRARPGHRRGRGRGAAHAGAAQACERRHDGASVERLGDGPGMQRRRADEELCRTQELPVAAHQVLSRGLLVVQGAYRPQRS